MSYQDAIKIYGELPLGLQVPQCHICTKFETDDNPLFAYSYLEREGGFRFIYRCINGHGYDNGKVFVDIQTNLKEVIGQQYEL